MTEHRPDSRRGSEVDYGNLDPFKLAAQAAAASTADNLEIMFGLQEVPESRGESAYVWDEGENYGTIVTEGLGTKNLVADAMREITGRTYYDAIAKDTVAMIVNDLITVGALPKVVTAHFSVGDSEWLSDRRRAQDLVDGWAHACNEAGATWGPGETPQLKDVLLPGVIELSGSAVGEIYPKDRLTLGNKLQPGDKIIYLPSSGIHSNGLTDARRIAEDLPEGYETLLSEDTTYGEALLTPTPIYVDAVRSLFEAGVDIHYMANITGHGWRKLMRAERELTYVINIPPQPQPVFEFIQRHSDKSDKEMYATFNMGMGFALYVSSDDMIKALKALQDRDWPARLAGHVEEGPRQVIISPKNIVFESDSLNIR
jgi:phosphoribosylformylglycinamidine cyclo-ligase